MPPNPKALIAPAGVVANARPNVRRARRPETDWRDPQRRGWLLVIRDGPELAGGNMPISFISPTAPAPVNKCPTFALTAPNVQTPEAGLSRIAPQLMQAVELNGVAGRRAGRVAFDVIHVIRRPTGLFVSGPHRPQLAFAVGRQQVRAAIVR